MSSHGDIVRSIVITFGSKGGVPHRFRMSVIQVRAVEANRLLGSATASSLAPGPTRTDTVKQLPPDSTSVI
jgi:hypothetical protein